MEKFLLIVIVILGAVAAICGFSILMAFPVKWALNFLEGAFFKGSCSSSKESK